MKAFITGLLLAFCVVQVSAQSLNKEQEALRNQIASYLQQRGYTVEKKDYGMKFKTGGQDYFIEIFASATNPMYVQLCKYVPVGGQLTAETAREKINSYNVKYAVKAVYRHSIECVVLTAEMFVTKASDFTSVFDTLLSQVKSAYNTVTNN